MKRLITNKGQLFALNLLIAEELDKRKKVIVSVKAAPKTMEQLGYLHSEVLPKLAYALYDAGEIRTNDENAAKYWLKRHIGYGLYYNFGDSIIFDPKSFADANIDILTKAIDDAIFEAAARGCYIAPPRGKDEAN